MTVAATIVDYGIGNILSVTRALERCGAEVELSSDPEMLLGAARLILPGVGAFADGIKGLRQRGLIEAIAEFAQRERPLLGICLGMQMLLDESEEFGVYAGLGLIPGRVEPIPATGADGARHKIPHIGWNALRVPAGRQGWDGSLFADVEPGEFAYFVHSFTAAPTDPAHRLADCHYNGRLISAAVQRDAVIGCQFHPEKSGPLGLRIIKRFLAL